MAIAVIAGLTFATVLTLILVPVLYSLTDDVAALFARHFLHPEGAEDGGAADSTPYAPAAGSEREAVVTR